MTGSHRTYIPRRGDFVHLNASPAAGHEMAGPHFGLVMSPQSYSRRTGMTIVLLASSKIKSASHPRYGNTQEIPAGIIAPTRDNPGGEGALFCDALRQIDWRERSVAYAGTAPREYVERALDRLLGVLEEDDE